MPLEHPLDRVVWLSLTTGHSKWAEGDHLAKRYPIDMAPFHALRDDSKASFEALARISSTRQVISLLGVRELSVPAQFELIERKMLNQMLGPTLAVPSDSTGIELLAPSDQPAMLELVKATQPGPFSTRTHLTGKYFGIKHNQRLVAMTGQRMRPAGFTELSAVCVHPEARGHGYAARLVQHTANLVIAHGDRPFLHVLDDNHSAIALYRKCGFHLRRSMFLTLLRKCA